MPRAIIFDDSQPTGTINKDAILAPETAINPVTQILEPVGNSAPAGVVIPDLLFDDSISKGGLNTNVQAAKGGVINPGDMVQPVDISIPGDISSMPEKDVDEVFALVHANIQAVKEIQKEFGIDDSKAGGQEVITGDQFKDVYSYAPLKDSTVLEDDNAVLNKSDRTGSAMLHTVEKIFPDASPAELLALGGTPFSEVKNMKIIQQSLSGTDVILTPLEIAEIAKLNPEQIINVTEAIKNNRNIPVSSILNNKTFIESSKESKEIVKQISGEVSISFLDQLVNYIYKLLYK